MKPIRFEAEVLEIKNLSATVKSFRLTAPDEFDYEPGQFVTVLIRDSERRSYSITGCEKGWFEIALNKVPNGVGSTHFHSLKVGDNVKLIGPLGTFMLKDDTQSAVFVSTGTGITPYVCMIPKLLQKTDKKVYLIAGFKTEDEILYRDFFTHLQEKYPHFEYHTITSREGKQGRVQDLLKKLIPEDFEGDYYLCGLWEMIKDVGQILSSERKVLKERIIFERYD